MIMVVNGVEERGLWVRKIDEGSRDLPEQSMKVGGFY